ncbi:MAG TPA: MFS transporter [Thermomicrobiales bacterium]|jgi:MFS family permease
MTFDRYRQVFANRSFRTFWSGFSFSVLGDGMTRVALIWFVYSTTGSARAVGGLLLCYTGPIIVGGLMAGMLLDRFDRRQVMIADNVTRGAVIGLIPLLHALGRLALWHAYVVAGVYGLLMMISLAGGPSLVPSLIAGEQLATANALEMLSFTLGGVIGPPLAGALIPVIGAPNVVIVDVCSYVLFALALSRVQLAPRPVTAKPAAGEAYHLGHAVRLLLGSRILLSTTAMFLCFNIGRGMLLLWLPILADRALGGGAALYGILLGAEAVGEVVSSLLAGGVTFRLPLGALICLAQCSAGVVILIILPIRTVWSAMIALALFGMSSAPLTIWAQTLRMRIIPEGLRGRAFALLRTLMQSGTPIGGALGGLLLPVVGIPVMIVLSACIVGAPGLVGLQVRELRGADNRRGTVGEAVLPLPMPQEAIEG